MIIIITGASHTGKTLLAQRMLEKYKYPYLSIDHLKMGLIRSGYTNLDWRRDFDARYLKDIQFICLAMTGEYIKSHFNDITGHASEIESRIADEDCTLESVQADNRRIIDGFLRAGEQITVIKDDYEKTMYMLLA